jgi:bifunctional UDP-N-acetylglucosamine pyrophosphorylase/glucosamine-1-phosphate N-acetyltransferase
MTPILIILAGGASSRMWPLREKSLLRFGDASSDEPLLIRQLRRYYAAGFEQAVIVANPDSVEGITSLIQQFTSMTLSVTIQQEAKGMGDALLAAASAISNTDGTPIYVTQVHDLTDQSLHDEMLNAHRADPSVSFITGYEREDYFPGGYLIVDSSGRITGIVEKPGAENRPSNLVNIVAHIHADAGALFSAISNEYAKNIPTDDHYERAMDTLMKDRIFRAVIYRGQWVALKYPWQVLDVMNYFLSTLEGQQVAESAFIAKTATLVGNVYIGERAKVFPGAAVVGPAYIGADTIVGNNALVRQSMVMTHCEVGFTTEIARSYVADRVSMHACRVLDSVFASGVNFSAGCTTANLRIDHGNVPTMVKGQRMYTGRDKFGAVIGEGAFLGVDVMTMPGVKVGEAAQIGPGVHLYKDVKDRGRVYVKQTLIVSDDKDTKD